MAFLVCGEFCGESGLREVGLGGIHPLTRRYALSLPNKALKVTKSRLTPANV